MSYTYRKPTMKEKGWRIRKFVDSDLSYPSPLCSKTTSKFADKMVRDSGLKEMGADLMDGGAEFDTDKIVTQLIDALGATIRPEHVHTQVLGDGFRAMHSASIVSVGIRLLMETEEESGDTSFTSIGSV